MTELITIGNIGASTDGVGAFEEALELHKQGYELALKLKHKK
jgi:hypothetical protein